MLADASGICSLKPRIAPWATQVKCSMIFDMEKWGVVGRVEVWLTIQIMTLSIQNINFCNSSNATSHGTSNNFLRHMMSVMCRVLDFLA